MKNDYGEEIKPGLYTNTHAISLDFNPIHSKIFVVSQQGQTLYARDSEGEVYEVIQSSERAFTSNGKISALDLFSLNKEIAESLLIRLRRASQRLPQLISALEQTADQTPLAPSQPKCKDSQRADYEAEFFRPENIGRSFPRCPNPED